MSRARFAVYFRETIGDPADYLAAWRVTLAQQLLRAGRPLKHIAHDVGYASPSALTRAFIRKTGEAPTHCLRRVERAVSGAAPGVPSPEISSLMGRQPRG